ncbi:helix-turn-helix domain-containing protein [Nocardia panacis]|uniref:Helix-turn-helix domain-containing protein n=1 Tax=Nocardia panacis TaxID=2340916 RepID=A0A3A4KC35_9NOCA|nr:helix-turn-helix domain-containing protein [Nocardia panacis]
MWIGVLGPFEVRTADGVLVEVSGARLRGLLGALALRPGQVCSKAMLVDWVWGARPPADASNALQRLVFRLRKVLPEGLLEGRGDGYRLLVTADEVDAVRFERLIDLARDGGGPNRLREGLGLWRGAAMSDIGLRESPAFDAAVSRLEGLRLTALEDRFDAEVGLGHGAELVRELTELVAAHPVRERFVAALMRALAAAGRDTEALRVYQRTREALAEELGVDPAPELSALHIALLRGELRGEDRKSNLRAELTSFVGRDADVVAVRALIAEHRLSTVVGPGGLGKTRLATETARTLLGDLAGGVYLVELATIDRVEAGNNVARAALVALGLRDGLLGEAPDPDPTDRVIAALRAQEMLLILDNCEHVIEAAASFADRVLAHCPRLRILATSRESLGITGEALWQVEPLELPAPDADSSEIESAAAVRLLRDRACAVRKDIAADAHTLSTMARVCRALDGMPLALELAAAKLRTISVEQLADRLDDRFRLLTGGSRTALPRHRTLRALIDWSWELLSAAERVVLRRLAVFCGGASAAAAEQVCAGADGDTVIESGAVFELLTALTEKSLLVSAGERYRMLGTIKEYAEQRLGEAGEADRTRRAHLAYFTELVEIATPRLRRAEQLECLAALEIEHDDIAAAMRGALAAGDAAAAMRLAAAAAWYWWLGGHKAEGIELIMAATAVPGAVPDEIRGVVYAFVVQFVTFGQQGDEDQVAKWIHQAYEISLRVGDPPPALRLVVPLEAMLRSPAGCLPAWEALLVDADPWVRALARLHLGKIRSQLGLEGADAYLELALNEFRVLGERWGISFALIELADRIAMHGEFAGACGHLEEAITVVTEVGAIEDVVGIRSRQAQLYWLSGDQDACAGAMAEAQRFAQRVAWPNALAELALSKAELARWNGDSQQAYRQLDIATAQLGADAERANIRAVIQNLLGYLAEEHDRARAHLGAAIQAASDSGHPLRIAQVLVGIADLSLRARQYEQTARLLAASARVRGLPDRSQPDAARIEQAARDHLGAVRFAAASAEGAQANWRELVAATLAR